ncbi:hypothetical protein F5X99DRAFT_413270 [Biscogniauxia marginata]|nr:hypothetical protein F5X99DRAFT_413270 [Biscogniauxia marginata]
MAYTKERDIISDTDIICTSSDGENNGPNDLILIPRSTNNPYYPLIRAICTHSKIWKTTIISYPGAAANESIMPIVTAALLFQHQRGGSMALYVQAPRLLSSQNPPGNTY